jgi:hypothetical protein
MHIHAWTSTALYAQILKQLVRSRAKWVIMGVVVVAVTSSIANKQSFRIAVVILSIIVRTCLAEEII